MARLREKPASHRTLRRRARTRARAHRHDRGLRHRGTVVLAPQTQYQCGALEIDLAKHTVFKAGEAVHLTPTEFKLLARLVRQAGQVVTHRQLLMDVWGADYVEHTHYLRLYMGQLRAKLEPNPTEPQLLLTEPGVGYRLAESA